MHPIERLRYVARSGAVEHRDLVREAAAALAGLGDDDAAGLVLSCKRLVERQPTSGPLWWLCARLLGAADARAEAWRCADEVDGDPTSRHLADSLPEDATVTVLGWPELASEALFRRGDVAVLVVDAQGEAASFTRRLEGADVDAVDVAESGTGAAVAASDVVVLEASAMGPDALLAPAGSRAAAAVAHHAEIPVWVVAGVGRVLPGGLWEVLVNHLDHDDPWDAG
ncbi:MAG: hypothetical protein H0U26_06320, partial [Acidimicrobiia bacterium]|nr:hypothetical protein [Acidimicrobiia bacterium]